ncbi:outer membrane beta-barrel protein [Microbulbifer yueqingensis]|uniref:Outer membrane protein beta-barrel domain-containing protein n=1 Tax=Microbulbifer yueqingensis TaxID=658219 RepID=A0A1G8Y344_9GAMM|nr:outer membrane beta-barrel protein [Microbulbifer yueqingensis]SDJ97258.1 Outer membrane protein beta-barrel domain-containing protein [Microbulbifer yueqingensis]
MARPLFLLAVLSVPILSLAPALPAGADFYSHRYVGASVGDTQQDDFCLQAASQVRQFSFDGQAGNLLGCDGSGEGWKLYTGWRWSPYLAVEASLQRLATTELDFELRNQRGEFLRFEDKMETHLVNAFAVGHWPVYGGLSLFAKAGAGAWNSELSERQSGEVLFRFLDGDTVAEELVPVSGRSAAVDNGFHWGYGAGISYRHEGEWTLRAEWEAFRDIGSDELRGKFDAEMASLGWSMHF